jgi:hypothetical protein
MYVCVCVYVCKTPDHLLGKLPEDDVEKRTDACMLLARLYLNCD